jgi:hypothetical protein
MVEMLNHNLSLPSHVFPLKPTGQLHCILDPPRSTHVPPCLQAFRAQGSFSGEKKHFYINIVGSLHNCTVREWPQKTFRMKPLI